MLDGQAPGPLPGRAASRHASDHSEVEGIVGRETELGSFEGFLDDVARGPSALVLEGEPGIGKTRLWAAAVRSAEKRSYCVSVARPTGTEAQLSFAALGDLLAPFADDVLPRLPAPQRRALEVALLLSEPKGAAPEQRAVAVGLLGALRALSDTGPVVVAIDDLQWLDPPSVRALEFAFRRLEGERLGILATARLERVDEHARWLTSALPEERLSRIRLGPLNLNALSRLVRGRLAVTFPPATLHRIHEASGGNPFFALELARALQSGTAELAAGGRLQTVGEIQHLIGDRLARLPQETAEALAAAAALSRPTISLVESVIGTDARPALQPAVEAGVIELYDDQIGFAHPLLASAAYGGVETTGRRGMHRRLAAVTSDPEERARHLALAAEGPDEMVAAALDEAARRARARGAPEAAADLGEQALRLTPPARSEDAHGRLIEVAGYQLEAGDIARSRELLEAAVAASQAGSQRADALNRLARVVAFCSDVRAARDLYLEALDEAGDDIGARARIEEALVLCLLTLREDIPLAVEHARAAVDAAEQVGDPAAVALALSGQGIAEMLLGEGIPSDVFERALALEDLAPGLRVLQQPSVILGLARALTDDLVGARSLLEGGSRRAIEHGDESSVPWILMRLSQVELLSGNWGTAFQYVEEAYEVALQTGQEPTQAILLSTRGLLEAHRGRVDKARRTIEQGFELTDRTGATIARRFGLWALGFLELSLENPRAAEQPLAILARETRAAGIGEPGEHRFLTDQIEALVGQGRLDEAATHLDWLDGRARALDRASILATVARCRGLMAAAEGDIERALANMRDALLEHERVEMPFERARTLLIFGSFQRRAKQRRAARESLQEAVAIFEELGAALWAARARKELGQIGGRAASPGRLTPAEERVAELVAEGHTNREVAAALFVTDRTVEGHLSRIYAKLGVRSRAELARAWTGPTSRAPDR